VAVNDENQKQALPLFVPEKWDREKGGRFFRTAEGGDESLGKGNHPAENRLPSAIPGVITGKLDDLIAMGRSNSLWTLTFGLACCAIEMISAHMAHHDFDRFGIVTWPSPRQSDVMIVAGTVVKKMADPIRLLYEQMPDPKWVIAMGTCATSGGPYYKSYSVVMGVDHIIPVDIYVPGCPPRPEALMDGFMKLQSKIKSDASHQQIDKLVTPVASQDAEKGTDDGAV